jgi:two-component system OmpR family sensor kinase
LDIDLPQSEKKTLKRFLLLYLFFVLTIFGFIIFLYYGFQKDLMLQHKRVLLNQYANELIVELKHLHINFDKQRVYPRHKNFNSAIYDSDHKLIFSTLKNPKTKLNKIIYTNNETIHYIKEPESYYLGAQYVLIEINDDKKWLDGVVKNIIIYGTIAFIFMLFMGYFLLKLFLKPMRDALHLLDTFIKDTTHELNTPVSTIVANIEMIDRSKLDDEKLIKKINRIDIGAKTISNIYDDLTYLILNNKIISNNKDINLKNIIEQRVEYFSTLANVKKIKIFTNLDNNVILNIDDKKISKLIDNLISNAIKYNKIGGTIDIELKDKYFFIKDSGKGISQKNIDLMFDRYSRFDKSVGGFGIGLNIVKLISQEYNLNIKIESKIKKGTKVIISW